MLIIAQLFSVKAYNQILFTAFRVNPKKMGDITRKMASQLVEDPDLKEFAKAVSACMCSVIGDSEEEMIPLDHWHKSNRSNRYC